MRKKKTTQQFIEELKLKRPDITVLGEYVKSNIKVEVKHSCGYQWEITPNVLLQGTYCPKCSKIKTSKKRSKTTKQFIEELKIINPEITVIGEYVKSNIKVEVKHSCGYQWEITPSNLLQGNSCPKCFGTFKKTTQQFIEELEIVNPEVTVFGEYVNSKTKIEVKHTCGYKWNTTPNALLQGISCPKCSRIKASKKRTKTMKQFIEELKIVNPEITVIGKYVADNNKIEVKHTCGYQWESIPGNLLQGTSCPVRVQVLLTTVEGGFNSIDDIKWLRHQLSDNVTIACSSLRLSNDFCLKYNTDEDYWMDKGELSITNRYIITLEDGTQIVLRNKSLSLTGEDPVEEEMVMNFLGEMQRGFKKEINIKSKE